MAAPADLSVPHQIRLLAGRASRPWVGGRADHRDLRADRSASPAADERAESDHLRVPSATCMMIANRP